PYRARLPPRIRVVPGMLRQLVLRISECVSRPRPRPACILPLAFAGPVDRHLCLLRQPLAESLRVVPRNAGDRMGTGLGKTGGFPIVLRVLHPSRSSPSGGSVPCFCFCPVSCRF